MALQIKFFGPFEVLVDSQPLTAWPRHKTQELLQLLASHPDQSFSQDQLLDLCFPDLKPKKALNNLHKRISELRRFLQPHLKRGSDSRFILSSTSGEPGYRFCQNTDCSIDLDLFSQSIHSAQLASAAERWTQAIDHYTSAISLYRDPFLCNSLYQEWTIAPRERWHEQFLLALSHLAQSHARLGQLSLALECCDRVLTHQPWNEPIYRQKMLYHYHLANRTKALDTFKECAALLKKHLDVTPSPETLALHQEILKYQVAPLPRAIPNNLPQALTSFIGRQRELSELSQLLEEKRLLSLAGVGGCGKTRLALELATTELKHYSDGIWWVELAALSDASLVVQALASAMGVQEQAKKTLLSTVSDALHTQEALIVLDNCEHVLTGSAELVQELLKGCTQLKIVVTSREPLGILGEVVWQVVPLAVPPQDEEGRSVQSLRGYEAVRLFEERARANEGKFEINKENAGAVAQICQRLDGLPLALELAAARVRGLSVREIARKLDKRFKLLAGGNRGALPRHQTLQGAMDWSYQLLTKKEQTLYYGGWRSLRGDGEWRQRSECVGERELSLKKCWR